MSTVEQTVPSQDFLEDAAEFDPTLLTKYQKFGDYYEGRQYVYMKDRNRRYMQRSGWEFSENFSEVVVDVFAERLVMTGFVLETKDDSDTDLSPLEQWLDGQLQYNRLDAQQLTIYTNALIKGDAYGIVDWDEDDKCPRLTYNPPERIKPVYSTDEPDTLEYVVKKWNSTAVGPQNPDGKKIVRMNLYYPDRVEKFYRLSNDDQSSPEDEWRTWQDEGDTSWQVPWVDAQGEPLGIPIVHFRHKHLGGGMGTSELRSTVSQQDLLNKMVVDMAEIFDYMAFPQRWIKGQAVDAINLTPGPGEYLTLNGEDMDAGQFPAADLSSVSDAVEEQLSRLARRSRTPLHLLTGGTPPSGEALKTAESGLVAKCKSAQVVFGQSWEDVAQLMLRLGAANGVLPVQIGEPVVAQAQWSSAQTRDDMGDAQYAQILHAEGLASKRTLQAGLGLDPDVEEDNMGRESDTLNQAAGKLLDAGAAGNGVYGGPAIPA